MLIPRPVLRGMKAAQWEEVLRPPLLVLTAASFIGAALLLLDSISDAVQTLKRLKCCNLKIGRIHVNEFDKQC